MPAPLTADVAPCWRGTRETVGQEKTIPSIEHPNDAVVRVTRPAMCGSDLHLYHGMLPDLGVGLMFGHEFVGTVHAVGSPLEHVQPGDQAEFVRVPFADGILRG